MKQDDLLVILEHRSRCPLLGPLRVQCRSARAAAFG